MLSFFGNFDLDSKGVGLYGLLRFHEITGDVEALKISLAWFRDRFAVGTTKVRNAASQEAKPFRIFSEREHYVAASHRSISPRRKTRGLRGTPGLLGGVGHV